MKLTTKLDLHPLARGEGSDGQGFYISTYRMPLTRAQGLERLSLLTGISMASIMNQSVQGVLDALPKDVRKQMRRKELEATKKPTVWGKGKRHKPSITKLPKESPAKAPSKAQDKRKGEEEAEAAPKAKKLKAGKLKPSKLKLKAKKSKEASGEEASSAVSIFSKLKKKHPKKAA